MRHLNEGTLRAFWDGELSVQEREQVRDHMGHCSRCARAAERVRARGERVYTQLASTDPSGAGSRRASLSPPVAQRRLDIYTKRQQEVAMPTYDSSGASRRPRLAWVAVAVVVLLGLSLTLQPVRVFAGQVLSIFRVNKIEVVAFDPSALFNEQNAEAVMQSLERVMDEQVVIEVAGEPRLAEEAEVRALSWGPVRLPQDVEGDTLYAIQPGAKATVKVDLPRIRTLMGELGYEGVDLPNDLDGATITVDLLPSVMAAYGACESEHGAAMEAQEDCTVLMQMLSPDITAPDGLDVEQLGQAYLQLLGLSPDEAAAFSAKIDWTATLVVPIPSSEIAYEEVNVDGVTGVLMRPTQRRRAQPEYLLMWVKHGVVYGLSGSGNRAEALAIANSLQ